MVSQGRITFTTSNADGVSQERVRYTAGGAVVLWLEDWPAGRVETMNGSVLWAGRGTDWAVINNTMASYRTRGEEK